MSWCGLGEIYSNWGSINFLNIRVCVFCQAGQSPAFIWVFSARPRFSPVTPRTRRSDHGEPLGSPRLLVFPAASFLRGVRGVVSVIYLQDHRFFLLSSPVRCWAHRLGFFLSLLYFHFWNFHFLPASISLLRFLSLPFSSVFITAQQRSCAGGSDLSVGWSWRLSHLCWCLSPFFLSVWGFPGSWCDNQLFKEMWAFGVCYETPEFLKNLLSWPTSSGCSNRAGKGSLSFLLGVGGSLSLQRTRPCPY